MNVSARTRAVLFDWRGTLAVTMTDKTWIQLGYQRLGRDATEEEVSRTLADIQQVTALPEFADFHLKLDCSAEFHRAIYHRVFAAARVAPDLAEALYDLESDPEHNPLAVDAPSTLRTLKEHGIRIALISDIHFDLRPVFEQQGLHDLIDAYVLSFEHGIQKPHPAMFRIALEALDVAPSAALMVGDRASHDGGAVDVDIPTLLLPPLRDVADTRLALVLSACVTSA